MAQFTIHRRLRLITILESETMMYMFTNRTRMCVVGVFCRVLLQYTINNSVLLSSNEATSQSSTNSLSLIYIRIGITLLP